MWVIMQKGSLTFVLWTFLFSAKQSKVSSKYCLSSELCLGNKIETFIPVIKNLQQSVWMQIFSTTLPNKEDTGIVTNAWKGFRRSQLICLLICSSRYTDFELIRLESLPLTRVTGAVLVVFSLLEI